LRLTPAVATVLFAVICAQSNVYPEPLSLTPEEVQAFTDQIETAETVGYLSGLGTRMPGYEGCERAADYVARKLESFGLQPRVETFELAVPVDKGASLVLKGGGRIPLRCLWPNLVRTSKLPAAGLSGPLLYTRDGALSDFNFKPVGGAIVLMEFNCATRWLNAAMLGAKAIVFVEPESSAFRSEATQKFLLLPAPVPRFWIGKQELRELADRVLGEEAAGDDSALRGSLEKLGLEKEGGLPAPAVTLQANMVWENVQARNIVAALPGTDPSLSSQKIVLEAYYDSISVVPTLAPGADAACGIATLLEMAKVFSANPPRRTVEFVATCGHFQALAGIREWAARHLYLQKEKGNLAIEYFLGKKDAKSLDEQGKLRQLLAKAEKLGEIKEPAKLAELTKAARQFLKEFRLLAGDLKAIEAVQDEWESLFDCERDLQRSEAAGNFELSRDASLRIAGLYRRVYPVLEAQAQQEAPEAPPVLFIGLDLSSRGQQMGVFYKGHFFDQLGAQGEFRLQRELAPIADKILDFAELAQKLNPESSAELVSGVVPKRGRDWRSYMPDEIALDCEVPQLAGVGSLSFVTTNDTRALVDTPNDTWDEFNAQNLANQAHLLFPLVYEVLNNPGISFDFKLEPLFSDIYAQVIEDSLIAYLPKTPIPGALVSFALAEQKSMMGVRGHAYTFSREDGTFELFGMTRERGKRINVWAFLLDPKDGSLERITNLAGNKGSSFWMAGNVRKWDERALSAHEFSGEARQPRKTDQRLPLFKCASLMVFDLLDQLYFTSLGAMTILDASTNSAPKYYATFMGKTWSTSYSEPCAIAFGEPETRLKLIFRAGLIGNKFTLLNSDDSRMFLKGKERRRGDKYVEGRGFLLKDREQTVLHSPFRAAIDMWTLDDFRMERLEDTGVRNKRVKELHSVAKRKLLEAAEYRDTGEYDAFLNLAREGWALEGRAYPSVQGTANDVIKGVIFYFAILMPFAFFAERLFFAFADIRKQLAGVGGFFMLIYVILHQVHPAFQISKTPLIILDGFFTLAIGGIVIMIVLNKFNTQMAKIRQKTKAVHGADVARGSAAMAAFVLGISNMRRRRMRTALTCVTLILLTFTVMSFTSFDTGLAINKIETSYESIYHGLLLRRRDWGKLEEHAYYSIADFFKTQKNARIALRTWKTAPKIGDTLSLQVLNAEDPTKGYSAQALVGVGAAEADITGPQRFLVAGRWFNEEEDKGEFVCITPKRMAEFLGINQDDFDEKEYRIIVSGDEYRVIGIIDGGGFYESKDLDNEPLTPVDFIEMQQRQEQADQMQATKKADEDFVGEEALPELYIHMEGDNVLLIPSGLSVQLGAALQSVAVKMTGWSEAELEELLEKYVKRLKLILFAGMKKPEDAKGKVVLYSSRDSLAVTGLKGLLVPILIAALIVFNTMLGSVYERTREISIYAAVGLAPVHISALFLAESCVYATMGAIIGYLLGQTVAFCIVNFNVWETLSLNYSSTAAVVTTLVVAGTVLLSTLFPAKKAAELSVPDETRKLTLPKPEGDLWVFDFPFTVSKAEAVALNMFLYDYFKAHDEDSIGRFCADQIDLSLKEAEGEPVYVLSSLVWIAPLDMGISQFVRIETMEAPDDAKVDVFRFHIQRVSGEVDTWRRMNTGFLKDLRKQLLIWRLVEPEYKRELTVRGYEAVGRPVPPDVLAVHQRAQEAEEGRKHREAEALAHAKSGEDKARREGPG
jgi:ABC-type lipoprotein release transport system permease subunit